MSSKLFKNQYKLNFTCKNIEEKYSDYEYQIIYKYSLWFSLYGLLVSSVDYIYESFIFEKVEQDPKFKFISTTRITSSIITGIFIIHCILVKFLKNKKIQRLLININYSLVVIPLFHFRTILLKQGLLEENLFVLVRTFEFLERIILIILNLAIVPDSFLINFVFKSALWIYIPLITGIEGVLHDASASLVLSIFSYFYRKAIKLSFYTDYIMREHNDWSLNLIEHMNSGFISWSSNKIIFMNSNLKSLIQSIIDVKTQNFKNEVSQQNYISKDSVSTLYDRDKINNFLNEEIENFPQMYNSNIQNKNEQLLAEQILNLLLRDLKIKNEEPNLNRSSLKMNEFIKKMKELYNKTNLNQNFISVGFTDFVIEKQLDNIDHKTIIEELSYEVFMRCKIIETNNGSNNIQKTEDYNLIGGDEQFEFIFIEITETKAKEKKRAELFYKTKFLSKIEHEFKNPLISITELTEQLTNSNKNVSDKGFNNLNYIKQIKSFCNYLLILIKDLNYFSLCNFGIQPKLETSITYLDEVLNFCRDMAEILLIKYNKSEVKFLINKNFQEDIIFMVDRTKLIQVIVNLISDSVKYTHKGAIELLVNHSITSTNEEYLEFQLNDTGIGISPEKIKRYEKSFTMDNSDEDHDNYDFSLGINFVNEILKRFDSELKIDSNSKGSIFSFKIKIHKILNEEVDSIFNLKNKKISPYEDFINNNDEISDEESVTTRKLSSCEINLDNQIRANIPYLDENEDYGINQNSLSKINLNVIPKLNYEKYTLPETFPSYSEINEMSFDLNTKFLIVVDDEKLTRMSTVRILNRTIERIGQYNPEFSPDNVKILETEDGIHCLYLAYNLLKKGYKNITILSDENMSHMNGSTCAEVLKNLKNLNANQIDFILLSAYHEINNAFLDYFISKPLSEAEATKIISKLVSKK